MFRMSRTTDDACQTAPHLKKSINLAHLEKNTTEQIIENIDREIELKGLETNEVLPWQAQQQQRKPSKTNKKVTRSNK